MKKPRDPRYSPIGRLLIGRPTSLQRYKPKVDFDRVASRRSENRVASRLVRKVPFETMQLISRRVALHRSGLQGPLDQPTEERTDRRPDRPTDRPND